MLGQEPLVACPADTHLADQPGDETLAEALQEVDETGSAEATVKQQDSLGAQGGNAI
jgi:hypothetical protein